MYHAASESHFGSQLDVFSTLLNQNIQTCLYKTDYIFKK